MVYQNEKAVLKHLGVIKTFEIITITKSTFVGTVTEANTLAESLMEDEIVSAIQITEK
jgi:hypothetical protein